MSMPGGVVLGSSLLGKPSLMLGPAHLTILLCHSGQHVITKQLIWLYSFPQRDNSSLAAFQVFPQLFLEFSNGSFSGVKLSHLLLDNLLGTSSSFQDQGGLLPENLSWQLKDLLERLHNRGKDS